MVCSFTRYAAHSLEQLGRRSVRCVRLSSCGKVRRNTLLGPLRCGEESAGGRSLLVGSRLRLSLTAVVARQVVASALILARGGGIHWRLEPWSVRTAQRVCGVSPVAGVEVGSRPWLTLTFRVRVSQGPFGCKRFPAAVGLVFLMVLVFFICRLRSRGGAGWCICYRTSTRTHGIRRVLSRCIVFARHERSIRSGPIRWSGCRTHVGCVSQEGLYGRWWLRSRPRARARSVRGGACGCCRRDVLCCRGGPLRLGAAFARRCARGVRAWVRVRVGGWCRVVCVSLARASMPCRGGCPA